MPSVSVKHYKLTTLAFASTALAALASPAFAYVDISGPSPFSGCTVGATVNGVNYLEAEVEPWVAVNPANPNRLLAGWQQDRWSDGGARSNMSAFSTDGGSTWNNRIVPKINACSGATGAAAFDRSTDPWVAFSADGSIAYYMSLSFFNDPPTGGSGANAMLVSRSLDGGDTWQDPKTLIFDNDLNAFNDKNSITADPHHANIAYAVWDRLANVASAANDPHGDGAADARSRRRGAINRGGTSENNRFAYVGPAIFTRTTDGGVNWDTPKIIHDPGITAQTIGNQIVVLPNGTVLNFYTNIDHNGGVSIGYVKSTDLGLTFGPGTTALKTNITKNGTSTPDAREPVRDGNILFDVAVDPGNGNLYLVWQSGQAQNVDRVAFSMSTNGGISWSTPVLIAKTPYSTNKLRTQSFVPSVEVGANHKVYVTYYDFTNDADDGKELTDYWSITCDIGAATPANCRTPGGWSELTRLTPTSFDMLDAPVARGHFLGDYEGLVRQGDHVRAVFGVSVGDNNNQIVTTLIP